jgi:hypothetical protein
LTALTVQKEAVFAVYHSLPQQFANKDQAWEALGLYCVCIAFVVFGISLLLMLVRGPAEHQKKKTHSSTMHAMLEHMLKAANK